MIGSQRTSTKEGRRLTTAGLIAVTAATLLTMAWAVFPSAALAGTGTQAHPTTTTVPEFATRLREAVRSAA